MLFLWRCPPDSVVDFGTLSMSFRAEVRRTEAEESASAYQTSRLPLEVTGKYARGDIKTIRMTTCTRDDRKSRSFGCAQTTALAQKSGMEKAANACSIA